jgi:hypothetical protein
MVKKGKEREALHNKSQKYFISRSHKSGVPGAISIKFGSLVYMVNVVNSVKFYYCSLNFLNLARTKVYRFPMLNLTVHTTELALTLCL